MKKKHFKRIFAFLLAVLLSLSNIPGTGMTVYATGESGNSTQATSGSWTDYAAEKFDSGEGTAISPYIIKTAGQLALLAKDASTYKSNYFEVDAEEIDLSAHEWVPISEFSGTFDGNGATIKGLKIGSAGSPYSTKGKVGLFGYLNGGTVKNLSVEVAIYTNGDTSNNVPHTVGAIAGECKSAIVDGCTVTGSIICSGGGHQHVRVGGVVGTAIVGTVISNCVNKATLQADGTGVRAMAGGLVAYMYDDGINPYVVNCCNLGNVTANSTSTATGTTAYAGGIVGAITSFASKTNYLLNCYNAGSISATGNEKAVGSIAGQALYSTLDYLYWLNGTASSAFGTTNATTSQGSGVSTDAMTQENLQGLADTLNINAAALAETYTDLSLQSWETVENGYPVLTGSLVDIEGGGSEGEGSGSEGEGSGNETDVYWTHHAAETFESGEGTESLPYIIKSAEQLALLAKSYNTAVATKDKYFKVAEEVTEINLSAHEWVPISEFAGTFDGNGATIKGLKIGSAETPYSTKGKVGLFGYLNGGTVKNLLVEVAIYTNGDTSQASGSLPHTVGAIAGECKFATVDSCTVTGSIICTASGYQQLRVGGVVGTAIVGTVISNCVNEITVQANGSAVNTFAGGVVALMYDDGKNPYVVNNCNFGNVTATATGKKACVGGIIGATTSYTGGKNTNYLLNCYNTGSISAAGNETVKGSIIGQAQYCSLAYLYWKENSAASAFGVTSSANIGSDASTAAMTLEQIKGAEFIETLNMNASIVNEKYATKAYKWISNTEEYVIPGNMLATDKVLNVTVNSERMGGVKVEVKTSDSNDFVETTTRAMIEDGSVVRLTPQPVNGIKTNSMTVNDTGVTLTNGYYEFTMAASTNVEIVFEIETITTADPIYVDPNVATSGNGADAQTPFKTLKEARNKVRTILEENPTANITVYLMGGTYVLDETLELDMKDTSFGRVTFKNYGNETPVITSGHKIPEGEFAPVEGTNYYVYQLSKAEGETYPAFRDLLVNGDRATLAKTKEYEYVKSFKNEVASGRIVTSCDNGWYISKEALGDITNDTLNGVELGQLIEWKSHIFHVGSIVGEDTASGEMEIKIKDNEWELYYQDPNKMVLTGRKYWLQNHMSFLDEPGEFYYDQVAGKIYYYPYDDEDMDNIVIEYATLDTLINIQNASNITFDGITFTGTTANYITEKGLATQLGCTISTLDNTTGTADNVPIAAILGDTAEGIYVQNCIFEELGGSAMVFNLGIKDLQVTENIIKDIAMAGVLVGKNQFNWNNGGLLGSSENVTINNNYITNIGLVVYGAPGIKVARSENLKIQHNTIIHVPYSGIFVGFGWSVGGTAESNKNLINADISYNYVEDYLYKITDGGALYTCGPNDFATNTELINSFHHNYVRAGAHNGTYTGIYHDGAASNWHTYNNVIDDLVSDKGPMFFQDDVKLQYTHNILAENNYTTVSRITTSATSDRNIQIKNNVVFADSDELKANAQALEIINNAGADFEAPMDVELRMADATMHYVVDSSKDASTQAKIEITNNSDKERTFTIALTDALPPYVSCELENDGTVTLQPSATAIVTAEFSITDENLFGDTEDYVIGLEVEDSVGRTVLYPRTFTVRGSTGEARISYATPNIDGVMDDAYMKSTSIPAGNIFNMFSYDKDLNLTRHDLTDAISDVTGFARLLWDEQYLYCYIYVEEKDSQVISRGMEYINDKIANEPNGLYRNDTVELYINTSYQNGKETKFALDAFGIQRYGENNVDLSIHNALPYATVFTYNGEIVKDLEIKQPTHAQCASTPEKPVNGYVIEMALPLTVCTDLVEAGKPQAGDKINFRMQNNDCEYDAQEPRTYLVSLQTATKEYLLVKDEDTSSSVEVEINNVGEEASGVTIVAPTGGWVEGTNTFTVTSGDACIVAVKNADGSYSRVVATATNETGAYKYTVEDMTAETEIVVALSGDTNGDGKVSNADITKLRAACAGKATLDGIQTLLGDVNGNGKVTNADITRLRAACAGKNALNW